MMEEEDVAEGVEEAAAVAAVEEIIAVVGEPPTLSRTQSLV